MRVPYRPRKTDVTLVLAERLKRVKPSPTVALTGRVAKLKAEGKDIIGLGVGEPDFDTPAHIADAGVEAIRKGFTRYTAVEGIPDLKDAIIAKFKRDNGIAYARPQILVSTGAKQTIYNLFMSVIDPGDEVVIPAPYWVSYPDMALLAEGTPVTPYAGPDQGYKITPAQLEAAITPKTRLLVLNSPNNPAGRVFSHGELAAIGATCVKHDLLVVTDEVYEHIVFDGEHVPIATLPGMRERTVTISSAGKTFSLTGWKIGWSCAAPELAAAVRAVHQFVTFAVATPFQHAAAAALAAPDEYYARLRGDYRTRRDRLCDGLAEIGFGVRPPEGTYFALADIRPLGYDDDETFCRTLVERVGVAAIPVSAFAAGRRMRHLVRFAFCKDDATLDEGLRRLRRLKG
jgi:aspartate/methionine/tyrosine aminotransferase